MMAVAQRRQVADILPLSLTHSVSCFVHFLQLIPCHIISSHIISRVHKLGIRGRGRERGKGGKAGSTEKDKHFSENVTHSCLTSNLELHFFCHCFSLQVVSLLSACWLCRSVHFQVQVHPPSYRKSKGK